MTCCEKITDNETDRKPQTQGRSEILSETKYNGAPHVYHKHNQILERGWLKIT
jgi:hypothetical protein